MNYDVREQSGRSLLLKHSLGIYLKGMKEAEQPAPGSRFKHMAPRIPEAHWHSTEEITGRERDGYEAVTVKMN